MPIIDKRMVAAASAEILTIPTATNFEIDLLSTYVGKIRLTLKRTDTLRFIEFLVYGTNILIIEEYDFLWYGIDNPASQQFVGNNIYTDNIGLLQNYVNNRFIIRHAFSTSEEIILEKS